MMNVLEATLPLDAITTNQAAPLSDFVALDYPRGYVRIGDT